MKKIATPAHLVFKDEQGIIHVEIIEGAHVDLTRMNELRKIILELAGGKRQRVLVDARLFHTLNDEAMGFLKNEMIDKDRLATAVVTDKLGIRIMIDYFTRILKTKALLKICTSKEEALHWLIGLKESADNRKSQA